MTLFLEAVTAGKVDIVRRLLRKGVATEVRNEYGETALQIAAKQGNIVMTCALLPFCNKRGFDKRTPLELAAMNGHRHVVELLLQSYVTPPECRVLPLCVDHSDVLELLLEWMPEGGKADSGTLILAAKNGNSKAVEILLLHGADKDARDRDGRSALLEAVQNDHVACADLLLRWGAKTGSGGVPAGSSEEMKALFRAKELCVCFLLLVESCCICHCV
jgi:ankyrin repeat protein